MKVYLTASTENIQENIDVFKRISSLLLKTGNTNTNKYTEHLLTDKEYKNSDKDIYANTLSTVAKSDLLLVDISFPSISIGFLIERAISLNIPVLCLCQRELSGNISTILKRYKSVFFKIKKYDISDVEEVLKNELLNFKKQKIKLNVFLDTKLDNFLKLQAKKTNSTKSQYLRDLITEKMKNIEV